MTSLGNKKHLERFILNRGGKTIEEIALAEHISEEAVRKSIRAVEIAKGFHTQEYLQEMLVGVVLNCSPTVQKSLLEALTAGAMKDKVNDAGEKYSVFEPDHDTRLKAIAEFGKIAVAAQPKPGHSTNVKVGVGLAMGQASGSFVGMEERMREIRQQRKDQPILSAPIVQATILNAEEVEDIDEGEEE
jgi:hypothetical protein